MHEPKGDTLNLDLDLDLVWFTGARIAGNPTLQDIACTGQKIIAIKDHASGLPRQGHALNGALVMPALAQWHTHIDKTFTVERAEQTEPGLLGAIKACVDDHINWSADDIAKRANKALSQAYEAGCSVVRTHVDWTQPHEPLAWSVLHEIAQAWQGKITVERVALTRAEFFDDTLIAVQVLKAIAARQGILGAFIHSSNATKLRLEAIVKLAFEHNLAIDLHLDEEINPQAQGLRWLLQAVSAHSPRTPEPAPAHNRTAIAVSHICALATKPLQEASALIAQLAHEQITVIALPSTNLFLQDQTDPACPLTPHIRGIAPVHELQRAGVNVKLSCDNIQDPFYPWGNYDPVALMQTAAPALHLSNCFDKWSHAIEAHPLVVGAPSDLVIFNHSAQHSWPSSQEINTPRLVVRNGQLVNGEFVNGQLSQHPSPTRFLK